MTTRVSGGRFLEILAQAPLVNLPIELDVYDGANPATMLATLEAAWDAALQVQMSEVGSGRFNLLRSDPKATAAILAKGNLVKVKTGGVYRGSWWIEEPVETLTSIREAEGESWQIKGRGALSYLERGIVYPPTWPVEPAAFRAASHGANAEAGATTVSATKPVGILSGDLLIAGVAFVGGSTKTVAPPLGWKEFRRVNYGTTYGISLYAKQAGSSESASYQWAFTTSTKAVVNIIALYNASTDVTTYGFASATQGSGTAIKSPSLTIEQVDGALLTFAASTGGGPSGPGMSPPAGYTEATDDAQRTGRVLESAYKLGPALGDTGDVTTTNSATGSWIGIHIYIPSTATNETTFAGETFGAILSTVIDRAQVRGAIPFLTYDFTGSVDSQGQPWPNTYDLTFHAGTSILDVWRHLVSLGLEGGMSHDLKLSAYVDMSRDRTADVILRKGAHFLGDVANVGHYADLRTRFLVEGAGGRIIEVTNPGLEAIPVIGRREGFLAMATSDSATDLARAGEVALAMAELEDQSRTVPVAHGTSGQFEPWDDYRLGDYIGTDADGTGVVTAERVVGITISHRESLDYDVSLDLNSVSLEAEVRMRRQLDALAKSSRGSSSGLSLGGSPGTSSGGAAGTVAVTGGDAPGYLLDKIDVTSKLTKTLGGVGGNRTVALDVAVPSLGTGTPNTSTFLRGDGSWQIPAGASIADRIWIPPGGEVIADEFADGALDPAWVRVDPTGNAAHLFQSPGWVEAGDVLSVGHINTDAGASMHALMRPITGSWPKTVQVGVRYFGPYAYNYLMLGPVLADGVTYGAGNQVYWMPYTYSGIATAVRLSLRPFINYTTDGQGSGNLDTGTNYQWMGPTIHLRLRWTNTNTYEASISGDGNVWLVFGTVTHTFTPTYAGVAIASYGGGAMIAGTFEYFRVYNT